MKQLIISILIAFALISCEPTSDFMTSPTVDINYKPLKLNDSTLLTLKKGTVNNVYIDSLKVGDTVIIKVRLADLKYNLKSIRFSTDVDSSTVFLLPTDKDFKSKYANSSDFLMGKLDFAKSTKSEEIELTYFAKKSSKTAHLTVYLTTESKDSTNMDSLKLSTPIKFLP